MTHSANGRERRRSRQTFTAAARIGLPTAASVLLACASALSASGALADEGADAYAVECSKCHGVLNAASETAAGTARAWRVAARPAAVDRRLAVALPYGPNLLGVVGRAAGSVEGFEYSKAFLAATAGSHWDAATLDTYLVDSQALAPGARMFYRQPDAAVRARVIKYLEEAR